MDNKIETTKPSRLAHSEGHVGLCFNESGSDLLTCGLDGDVRVWENLDEDDVASHRIGECVYSILFKNNHMYVSSECNTVQALSFPDGAPDGVITRFSSPVYHTCSNEAGTHMLAGSGDFTVKYVEMESGSQKLFRGHEAPVLSVSLDPQEEYIASSSCDGTVKIWKIEDQSCVKTLAEILPKSNDFGMSKSLCRLLWHSKTRMLMVPTGKQVQLYECGSWTLTGSLTDSNIKELVSLIAISPCSNYVAGGCIDGLVVVWEMKNKLPVKRYKHNKGLTICSLAWNPAGNKEIAYADNEGNIGVLKNAVPDSVQTEGQVVDQVANQYADLFDDDDDMLADVAKPGVGGTTEDSDDDLPKMSQRKRVRQIIDDENSMDVASAAGKAGASGAMLDSDNEDAQSTTTTTSVPALPHPVYVEGPKPTPLQRPFQSGSTPVHLTNRFMVWNSVGIIRQYNTEEESSIDIEFHDTSTHHSMHVDNDTLNHTMGAISEEAILLACEANDDIVSQLVCMHFASWDNYKEWSVSMPQGEDIQVIAVGRGWVAAATNRRNVRVFTIGGIQREIVSLPGPIVTMSGHNDNLMVVYHDGVGVPGDQCLAVQLFAMNGRKRKLIGGERLPLSPKSTLSWIGFSAEGTPISFDSCGIIRLYNRNFGPSWTQVANAKKFTKGKSDHYWIVGIYENAQQLRCIACKGSTYPATLPRPAVSILPFELPVCETSTEKGSLEENYLRLKVFSGYIDFWKSQGLEMADEDKDDVIRPQKEALMKMFALACKSEREVRAVEICELMPDEATVHLAIKYASRLRHIQLAEKVSEVAQAKADQEAYRAFQQFEDDDEEHTVNGRSRNRENGDDCFEEEENILESESQEEEHTPSGPLLNMGGTKEEPVGRSFMPSSGTRTNNPFKASCQKSAPTNVKGSSVFDNMEKGRRRSGPGKDTSPELKPKRVIKKQGKLFVGKKASTKNKEMTDDSTIESPTQGHANKRVSAFDLWFENCQSELEEQNPDKTLEELRQIATPMFTHVSKEEKKEWMKKAKAIVPTNENCETKKRKREDETELENGLMENKTNKSEDMAVKKKKPLSQSTNSRLAAFSKN